MRFRSVGRGSDTWRIRVPARIVLITRHGAKRARTADLLGAIQVQPLGKRKAYRPETACMQGFGGSKTPLTLGVPRRKTFSRTRIGHASPRMTGLVVVRGAAS